MHRLTSPLVSLLTALLCFLTAPAFAERPGPTDRLTLSYTGYFLGLPVSRAAFRVEYDDEAYRIESAFKTAGLVGFFKRSQVNSIAVGRFDAGAPQPTAYGHREINGRKVRDVALSFGQDDVTVQVWPPFTTEGVTPVTAAHRAESRDPVSAIFAMMLPGEQPPCGRQIAVFDSKLRYDLTLSAGKGRAIRNRAHGGPGHHCQLRYTPIAGHDPEDLAEPEVYQTPVDAWLANRDDGLTPPLRIKMRLRGIAIRVELKEMARDALGENDTWTIAASPPPVLRPQA